MAIGRLALASFRQRRTRTVLTVLAVALSVSLVVAVTSGYASLEGAIFRYYVEFMGSTDARIAPEQQTASLPESLVEELRDDDDVRLAVGRLQKPTNLLGRDGKPIPGQEQKTVPVIGVRLPEDAEVGALKMDYGPGNGGWFTGPRGNVAVVDQEAAQLLDVKVGSEFVLPWQDKRLKLTVVGIVRKPAILAKVRQTIYVPLETLQEFLDTPGQVSTIAIDLEPGTNAEAFAQRWRPRLAAMPVPARIMTNAEATKELENQLQGMRLMSYLGGSVAMLAATFIVFSTLSMGVAERQRTLAMLRAIGALRWQVGALVLAEGVIIALAGAALGVPLGIAWVELLAWKFGDFFLAGTFYSVGGMAYGAGGATLAAVAASVLPAWNATRLDVVESLTSATRPASSRTPFRAAAVGAVLIFVDSALMFLPGLPRWVTFYGHFAVGIPCLFVGFFLLAPACVWAVERGLARAAGLLLRVNPSLLAQQLTGGIWRAAGTGAALMVGLAILVVLQTQGNTLLNGWRLPTRFPDIFIFAPFGLTREQVRELERVEGIADNQVLPLAFAVPRLEEGFFSELEPVRRARKLQAIAMPDATMFFAVEPYQAFRMMELEFREGNPDDAAYRMSHSTVRLASGTVHRGGVDAADVVPTVTIHWRAGEEQRLAAADVASAAPDPAAGGTVVTLEDGTRIVGSVRQEGDVLVVAPLGPGSRTVPARQVAERRKTGRSVIVTQEFKKLKGLGVGGTVKLKTPKSGEVDFTIAGVIWSPGLDMFARMIQEWDQFSTRSAGSIFGTIEDLRADFGESRVDLVAANLDAGMDRPLLEKRVGEKLSAMGLVFGDVREIKANVDKGFRRILALMSTVALAAIAVASLGVTNTVMASVRSRRWQLGILRSIGLTRAQLLRLIVAEGLLLGLVGVALGVSAGLLMSLNANGLSDRIIGYDPPIDVPWDVVLLGVGIILVVAALASLWPATQAARSEPLELLQGGRAAA